MWDRSLVAALGASLVAHVAILGSTGGFSTPPDDSPVTAAVDARLVLIRVPEAQAVSPIAAPVPPAARPKAAPKPRVAPAERSSAVEVVGTGAKEAATPPDLTAEDASSAGTPAVSTAEPPFVDAMAELPVEEIAGESFANESDPAAEPSVPAEQVPDQFAGFADESGFIDTAAAGDPVRPALAGWPDHGSIRFRVLFGERGFVVGEARHDWTHSAKRYRMSVSLHTTGVVDLFRSLQYAQHSEGRVGPKGLLPDRFRAEQSGKPDETAEFDWKAGQVTMRRGTRVRVAKIQSGDQDLLSLWHQIGIVGAGGLPLNLNVVSGKAATPSMLERVGDETVSMPIGTLDTLRLRARALDGRLSIDIWLARNYGMLPVRIRVVDDKGEVLEQQAIELRLAPPGARTTAEADPDGALDEPNTAAAEMIELRASEESTAHLTIGN